MLAAEERAFLQGVPVVLGVLGVLAIANERFVQRLIQLKNLPVSRKTGLPVCYQNF